MQLRAEIADVAALLKSTKFADAAIRCAELLQVFPRDPELLQFAAITAAQSQKYREALGYTNLSLEIRPDHPATMSCCRFRGQLLKLLPLSFQIQ